MNDQLKNICQTGTYPNRSLDKFVTNLLAGILDYQFLDKKPTLNLEINQNIQKNLPIK